MNEIIAALKGKRSYIIAISTAVLGILQGLGLFTVPDYVYVLIASAFGITIRAGVNSVADTVKPKT